MPEHFFFRFLVSSKLILLLFQGHYLHTFHPFKITFGSTCQPVRFWFLPDSFFLFPPFTQQHHVCETPERKKWESWGVSVPGKDGARGQNKIEKYKIQEPVMGRESTYLLRSWKDDFWGRTSFLSVIFPPKLMTQTNQWIHSILSAVEEVKTLTNRSTFTSAVRLERSVHNLSFSQLSVKNSRLPASAPRTTLHVCVAVV